MGRCPKGREGSYKTIQVMIKKEYIQPEVKEIKILLPTILAGSEQLDPNDEIVDQEDIASMDLEFGEY